MADELTCPTCGNPKFTKGPSGGLSQNIRCDNGHYWNISAFGWEPLEPPLWAERQRLAELRGGGGTT